MSRCGECKLGCYKEDELYCEENLGYEQCIDRLQEALYVADRPQGKWIIEIDANGNTYGRCLICGMKQYAGQLNYCPECGARMKGTDDE